MRAWLLLAPLLFVPAPALAQDDWACEAVEEVLHWTAEALFDIRAGKPIHNGFDYIVDAVAYAADRNREDGWPDNFLGVLDELGMLASMIHDRGGMVEPGEAEGLLDYADALAATTLERCGQEEVPVFVRPGVGDTRACRAVIETLERLETFLPSARGDGPAYLMLGVAAEGREAAGQATAAQWSAATVVALTDISTGAELISKGETPANAGAAERFVALAATVVDEARAICLGDTIPFSGTN